MDERAVKIVSNWVNIPCDVLRKIAGKTHHPHDLIRMGMVCRDWYLSLKDEKISFPICLKLAEKTNPNKSRFYCTCEEIFIQRELPEIQNWGSPFGWLTVMHSNFDIEIFNPLSKVRLALPHKHTLPAHQEEGIFGYKFILCSSPNSSGYIVMAIYHPRFIAFARPGDTIWTPVHVLQPPTDYCRKDLCDAINFKDNFYAVREDGMLFMCSDLFASHPIAEVFANPPHSTRSVNPVVGCMTFLFELEGNLCMIMRDIIRGTSNVDGFQMFKLDLEVRKWEKLFSLGNRSVFIGGGCTFSVVADYYKHYKPNCVYFIDDLFINHPQHHSVVGIIDCDFLNKNSFENGYFDDDSEYGLGGYENLVDLKESHFPRSKIIQDLHFPISRRTNSSPVWLIPSPN